MNNKYFSSKTLIIIILLCSAQIAICNNTGIIRLGDTRETVITNMGKPTGIFVNKSIEILTYKRGLIKLQDGKVIKSDLVSEKEADIRYTDQQQRHSKKIIWQKQQLAEGTAIKEKKKNDKIFASRPASERLNFWKNFQRKYPNVSVNKEIALLKKELHLNNTKDETNKLENINAEITLTETKIKELQNATGLSRGGLLKVRKELVTLKSKLEELNTKRDELVTITNKDKKSYTTEKEDNNKTTKTIYR